MRKTLPVLFVAAVMLTACATFNSSVITVTEVVDAAMKEWAALSVAGKTTPVIDSKVVVAHDRYRQACSVMQVALVEYKQSGNNAGYVAAVAAARAAADSLIDLIVPLVTTQEANSLKTKMGKAKTI